MTIVRLCLVLMILALLPLAGCSQHQRFGNDPPIAYAIDHTKQPVVLAGNYGGSMTTTILGDPKTLNAWVADDADSATLLSFLYDSLEERDGFTLKFIPRMAELPNVSADGLIYTYTLRPGLKWSDGVPITTKDVAFTLKVLFDPNIQTLYREGMLVDVNLPNGLVKREPFKWTIVNDRTIKFILPVKWAPAEEMFSFPIAPQHCLEKIYDDGQFNSAYEVDTPPSQLVGSGPYLISQYVPGQRVVFKPNPQFWRYFGKQRLPYLDTFSCQITPDTNAMVLNFRGGGSDVLGIPLLQYPTVAEYAKRDNYTVVDKGPDWGFSYLAFNLNPAAKIDRRLLRIFSDVRFRQACSYAIDRQGICDDILIGLAHPLYGPETPADVVYFDSQVRQYEYNEAKARQLLFSMGMTERADGVMLYGGKPVSFNILTNTENKERTALATVVANDLQSIGLDAKFTPINFNALIVRLDSAPYEWEAHILGFTGGPEPNDGADIWRSSAPDHIWNPSQKQPATTWEARIDRDFTDGAHELDPSKRKKYYNDWQETMGVEQPMIFLTYENLYSAVRNHYANLEPSSFDGLVWNLEEVYSTRVARVTP
jgi:peptide/nickel transport system substrate-binding protein